MTAEEYAFFCFFGEFGRARCLDGLFEFGRDFVEFYAEFEAQGVEFFVGVGSVEVREEFIAFYC